MSSWEAGISRFELVKYWWFTSRLAILTDNHGQTCTFEHDRNEFSGHVQCFRSYSFGHLESVKWFFTSTLKFIIYYLNATCAGTTLASFSMENPDICCGDCGCWCCEGRTCLFTPLNWCGCGPFSRGWWLTTFLWGLK